MNLTEEKYLEIAAYEAFIRRASQLNFPFMLKGSFVTRQYFPNPGDRIPNDLDWICLHHLSDTETAESVFNEWAIAVTKIEIDDGVKFRNFQENAFWRMIDYAMSDDFPTVNTDLKCWVNGKEIEALPIDVSFNLPIENDPIPLIYKPLQGEPFTIPKTVPLSSQVAWKLHQTLVRPRFKDIFDLIYLLKHSDFNDKIFRQTLQTLVNECNADNINAENLEFMINGNLGKLFPKNSLKKNWDYWRYWSESFFSGLVSYGKAEHITDTAKLTKNIEEFEADFNISMINAGFNLETIKNLPKPRNTKNYCRNVESEKIFDSADSENFFDRIKNWLG